MSKETIYSGEWLDLFRRVHTDHAPSLIELRVGGWDMVEVTQDLDKKAAARTEMIRFLDELAGDVEKAKEALIKEGEGEEVPEVDGSAYRPFHHRRS